MRLLALLLLVAYPAAAVMTPAPVVEPRCWYVSESKTLVACHAAKFTALMDEMDELEARATALAAEVERERATATAAVGRCAAELDACRARPEPETDVRSYALVGLLGVVVGVVLTWWAR